jgi:hypothetical protein
MRFGILVLIVRLCNEILCGCDSWSSGNLELRLYRIILINSKVVNVVHSSTLKFTSIFNQHPHSWNSQPINKT